MNRPTPAELRAHPTLGPYLADNGFPLPAPIPDTYLQEEITLAWGYIEARTCRDLDTLDPVADETLAVIAKRAVYLRLLQQTVQEGIDYTTDALNDMIKSFAVPGYSETR